MARIKQVTEIPIRQLNPGAVPRVQLEGHERGPAAYMSETAVRTVTTMWSEVESPQGLLRRTGELQTIIGTAG
jgi:hypothetical protein